MKQAVDLTGQTFGLWKVVSRYVGTNKTKPRWNCICQGCGKEFVVYGHSLKYAGSSGCHHCRSVRFDLVGNVYGDLVVIKFGHQYQTKNGPRNIWVCLCQRCNQKTEIKQGCLINDKRKVCWSCEMPNGKGAPNETRILNSVFLKYQASATRRGYSFELTKNEFYSLVQQNCYYCGIEPTTTKISWSRKKILLSMKLNGVDRVDNSVGYKTTNVVSCCKCCNIAKSTMNEEQFIKLANNIAKKHPR